MLSSTLIQTIEDHWRPITERVVQQIEKEPRLSKTRGRARSELHSWVRSISEHLEDWLAVSTSEELQGQYERMGPLRFEESVPLPEAIYTLQIVKNKMIEFVRDEGYMQNAIQLYAEQELEHRMYRCFDELTYQVIRQYEQCCGRCCAPACHWPTKHSSGRRSALD